nr:cytochrome c [uncultured Steroidobacter sp.]
MSKAIALGVSLGVSLLLPVMGQADDKDVVDYRQHIMKSLEHQTAVLGQILSGAGPTENTLAHMETLALTASMALKSFEPKVQGGASKPEVWKDWADFSKRMKEFAEKSAEMAKVGREQGVDQAAMLVIEALPCKGCHDVYRDEKKI